MFEFALAVARAAVGRAGSCERVATCEGMPSSEMVRSAAVAARSDKTVLLFSPLLLVVVLLMMRARRGSGVTSRRVFVVGSKTKSIVGEGGGEGGEGGRNGGGGGLDGGGGG